MLDTPPNYSPPKFFESERFLESKSEIYITYTSIINPMHLQPIRPLSTLLEKENAC